MSKAKRQLSAEAIEAAVTKGNPQPRKLPDTIPLTRSQVYSLNALNSDEQNQLKQLQQWTAALEATRKARVEVLNEVGSTSKVMLAELNKYQYDGAQLVLAAQKE